MGSIALAQLPAEFLFAAHLAHEALLHLDAATAAHHLEHFAHLGVLAEVVGSGTALSGSRSYRKRRPLALGLPERRL